MRKARSEIFPEYEMIGVSDYIQSLKEKIKRVADNDDHVFIQGPTGSGKEVIARNIHSNREEAQKHNFVGINCGEYQNQAPLFRSELFGTKRGAYTGAIDKLGLISSAKNGTLFLDEIEDLNPECQSILLRFLDEKKYRPVGEMKQSEQNVEKIKIIAATNKKLKNNANFRQDLYFRLAGQIIETEALKGKIGDIVCLINHFLSIFHKSKQFDPRARFLLYFYDFPGNVRELKNLMKLDYPDILDQIKNRAKDLEKLDENASENIRDALEFLEEDLSRLDDLGNYKQDHYHEEFGSIMQHGYSEKVTLEEKKRILKKRNNALIERDKKIVEKRLKFFEIAILAQNHNCSINEVAELLHITDRRLYPECNFLNHFRFKFPEEKLRYSIETPLDVFPEPVEDN